MCERDGEQLGRGPDSVQVMIHALPHLGVIGVVIEAAAHLEQLGDRDLVTVGHACDVLRHGIVETELVLLRQKHDERGGHGLGVGGDTEVGVGAGRVCCSDLCGAVGDGEHSLRCAQENYCAGEQEFFGSLVEHSLQRGLVDLLKRRGTGSEGVGR